MKSHGVGRRRFLGMIAAIPAAGSFSVAADARARGMTLKSEGGKPIYDPTLNEIFVAIDSLTAKEGPGFCILERRPDFGFAQVGGGSGVYVAEWREWHGREGNSPLYVAGSSKGRRTLRVEVPTTAPHTIKVMENECLSLADAKTIISAFARDEQRPDGFLWRDITHKVAAAKTQ